MKIRINPLHRIVTACSIILIVASALNYAGARPVPRNDSGGCGIAVAVLVCGGVVVYCLVSTCKKVFGTNNPPQTNLWAWTSNQSPPCIEFVVPCSPCGQSNSALQAFGTFHELQRTTNGGADWESIQEQSGNIDELVFEDYDPPQSGAIYRLISW